MSDSKEKYINVEGVDGVCLTELLGKKRGVYGSWRETKSQTEKFPQSVNKGLVSQNECELLPVSKGIGYCILGPVETSAR